MSGVWVAWVGRLLARATNCRPTPLFIPSPKRRNGPWAPRYRGSCVAFLTDGIVPRTLPISARLPLTRCGRTSKAVAASHGRPTRAHARGGSSLDRDGRSCSRMRNLKTSVGSSDPVLARAKRSSLDAYDGRHRLCPPVPLPSGGVGQAHAVPASHRNATWLILPVVICLSQRLSHACVSMN